MKTLFFLFIASISFAGPKAEKVENLAKIRLEILEKKRAEMDKKYVADLEQLMRAIPTKDLEDQMAVQKEIWKVKFLGTYRSKNREDYIIQICEHGVVYRVSNGQIGKWEMVQEDGQYVFKVTMGDWMFLVKSDQTDNYEADLFCKGKWDKEDGLVRVK